MPTDPDSDAPKKKPEQYLNVRIEGKVAINEEPKAQEGAAENAEPEKRREQIAWYTRFFRWAKADPNAFFTMLATIVMAIFTGELYCVSNRQWQTMLAANQASQDALHITERPYVSIGTKDGTLIDLPTANTPLRIYFVNSGHSPAMNFKLNWFPGIGTASPSQYVYKSPGIIGSSYTHIERWKNGAGYAGVDCNGPNIAAGGTRTEFIAGMPPYLDKADKGTINSFDILGSFEYCDEFGAYHCTGFTAHYEPSIHLFVSGIDAGPVGCPNSAMSDRNPYMISLPRCPQPSEANLTGCSTPSY